MEIFTTMITPYKKDGSVDTELAEKYVDWYFQNGLTGIFALCLPKILRVTEKAKSLQSMLKVA